LAGSKKLKDIQSDYHGTVVNIQINTVDTKSYGLASVISPKDIF